MTEEKIPLAKLYVVIGGSPTTLWQMRQENLHPPALPEKEKTRKIRDFCTETICDKGGKGGGGGGEGDMVITLQNIPFLKIFKLAVGWLEATENFAVIVNYQYISPFKLKFFNAPFTLKLKKTDFLHNMQLYVPFNSPNKQN